MNSIYLQARIEFNNLFELFLIEIYVPPLETTGLVTGIREKKLYI